jgi:hypothetical protein
MVRSDGGDLRTYDIGSRGARKIVLQLRRMPRCDKNFCFACARSARRGCRSVFAERIVSVRRNVPAP